MKNFNLARYIVGILIPLISISYGSIFFVVAVILVLLLNNIIDDIVFYYGSCYVDEEKNEIGIPSPVDGIVTNVETRVPLYNHIHKSDVLTKSVLIDKGIAISEGLYEHVTIFLNKFNKHLVLRLGTLKSMKQYYINDNNVEMVNDGELVASNKGCYLTNTFIDLEYTNGIHVIVTMDKYISKAVMPSCRNFVEMLICRGSQCDIYAPSFKYTSLCRLNDVVSPYTPLFFSHDGETIDGSNEMVKRAVYECIKNSGFTLYGAFKSNLIKTLKTYKHNYKLLAISLIMALFCPISYALGFYLYLFLFDRSMKNLMYAAMNIIGYKEWMTNIYNLIHKTLLYGK